MAVTETTYTAGQALQQRVMWEVDFGKPTRGVYQVQATLVYEPHDAEDEEYHNWIVAEGGADELVDYQWETVREPDEGVNCIYPARADGSFVEDWDGHTHIYASRDEAVAACVEALQKRIAKAQAAIAKLSGKEAR